MPTRRALLYALALPALPATGLAASLGGSAPDFALPDVQGGTRRLSDFRGRHVVLEWTNPGCPFVQKHYRSGNMQTLQREAAARQVVWLTINSTEPGHADYLKPAELQRWMAQQQAAATAVLLDESGQTGKAYGARVTPHMYLIDPQGRLIYAGGIDSIPSARVDDIAQATNYVRLALTEALAGRPLSRPSTAPYGCSIKYAS